MREAAIDVAVVGGAAMGSAIAYFLTLKSKLRVTVFEKDPGYERAATTLSAGGIRQQFTQPENILMSRFGVEFLTDASERLAVGGRRPEVGFTPRGYLTLASERGREALAANWRTARDCGAEQAWLEPAELARRFPWMHCEDLAAAVLGLAGEGTFDPWGLLQALKAKAVDQGAVFRQAEVAALELENGQIAAVLTADGERAACGAVVNAAGPGAGAVARMAGIDLPVMALKAETFFFRAEAALADCPIILDRTGLHLRPEGEGFICAFPGSGAPADAGDDFSVDYDQFEARIWPALAHRVPCLSALKLVRAWAGHVEFNRFDQNPVIGPHPEVTNFHFANGFSGHGIQHAPAVGRAMAELITTGAYQSLDLSRFDFARIARNQPVPEVSIT